jgi:hypothetical protein
MKKEDIIKELDKAEIKHDPTATNAELKALLDNELAKRASGDDSEPEQPDEADELLDTEPTKSEAEKADALPGAQEALAKAEAAADAANKALADARVEVAKNLPSQKQVPLAECVARLHADVKNDMAVAAEMETLTKRFQKEAEAILNTEA